MELLESDNKMKHSRNHPVKDVPLVHPGNHLFLDPDQNPTLTLTQTQPFSPRGTDVMQVQEAWTLHQTEEEGFLALQT